MKKKLLFILVLLTIFFMAPNIKAATKCDIGKYVVSAKCTYGDPFAFKNEDIPEDATVVVEYGKSDDEKTYIKYQLYNFSAVNETYKGKTVTYSSREVKYSDFFSTRACPETVYTGVSQVYEDMGKVYDVIPLYIKAPGDEWNLKSSTLECEDAKPEEKIDHQYIDDDTTLDHTGLIDAHESGDDSYDGSSPEEIVKGRDTEDIGTEVKSCPGLIGENVLKLLKNIRNIIMIAGPIIAIVMGTYDLVMAMVSGEDDAKKKGFKKAKNRMIAAALLLIIPYVLNLLLNIVSTVGQSCV